jgi:hypothetical protein
LTLTALFMTLKPIHIVIAYLVALVLSWKLTPALLWASGLGGAGL